MMKVVSLKICPFVQRVTSLLEAKNVPYEIEFIDLKNKPQWFLDISPNAQVPVLILETGEVLFESDAIAEYIDDITAPIEVGITPEQRAKDRAWSYQATKHYLLQCSTMRSPNAEILQERQAKLSKVFEKAEAVLGEHPFFKGDSLSNVDIAWLPLLHRASIIEEKTGYDLLGGFPKVKSWQSAVLNTGIADRSVAVDFLEEFYGFYLTDKTYLGNLVQNR
ncbi:glutathione S-transferase family protein [Pseudoalteromonas sp. JBTF-M23]|uniref:Glutathione S-transferase family protein n=1 Tax=Pseudoalteromonas caenipelagi TaxID=2726988 RepID=A0A849VFH3_9GAMM|nr:glutathione S-transferase family protein [Pseudoalteromonas caenipelagi]NOU51925.1 glutathione S-transferase family protein [Pseudoalteromonas caenipelagi]